MTGPGAPQDAEGARAESSSPGRNTVGLRLSLRAIMIRASRRQPGGSLPSPPRPGQLPTGATGSTGCDNFRLAEGLRQYLSASAAVVD
jgi:hypothetical protein